MIGDQRRYGGGHHEPVIPFMLYSPAFQPFYPVDYAAVLRSGYVRPEGSEHVLDRRDPVALLEPELGGAVKPAGSLRRAQKNRDRREQIGYIRKIHVDRGQPSRAGAFYAVPGDRDGAPGISQYVYDSLIPLQIVRIWASGTDFSGQRSGDQGKRRR